MSESHHKCVVCGNPAFDQCFNCGAFVCPRHSIQYRVAASAMGGTWASHILCPDCADLVEFREEYADKTLDILAKFIVYPAVVLMIMALYLIFGNGEFNDRLNNVISVFYVIYEGLVWISTSCYRYFGIDAIPLFVGFPLTIILMYLFTLFGSSRTILRILLILFSFFGGWIIIIGIRMI